MSRSTYFIQECPTCGRRLQIRVEYLGRQLVCQHCHGQFEAADPANQQLEGVGQPNALLQRANRLLETVAQRRAQYRLRYPR